METDVKTAEGGETLLEKIVKLKFQLSECIEPNFGFLDQLVTLGVFNYRQETKILQKETVYERNDAILDGMMSEDQCDKFLTALERTEQQHVVNFIKFTEDELEARSRDVRPLSAVQLRALEINKPHLMERFDPDLFVVGELFSAKCISSAQKELINEISHRRDKCRKLLDFMRRRSLFDFKNFVDILGRGSQAHLVKFLAIEGVLVGIDAELDETSVENVDETEDRIVSQWSDIPGDARTELRESMDRILNPLGLQTRLVVLEKQNSIGLYLTCLMLLSLIDLRRLWSSGKLRPIVELLFTLLSGATRPVRIKRLLWPEADYQRCVDYFKSITSGLMSSAQLNSVMDALPFQMLEMLLMKVFKMLYKVTKSAKGERTAFITVASVASAWRLTMIDWPQSKTKRWLKHKLGKQLERSTCRPLSRQGEKLLEKEIVSVCGVTRLDDVLYVICCDSSTIQTFDAVTFHQLNSITINGLEHPWDIVCCNETKQLFVSDHTGFIWRVSPMDDWDIGQTDVVTEDSTNLSTSNAYEVYIKTEIMGMVKLSVMRDEILVWSTYPHRLVQYSCKEESQQQKVRDVELQWMTSYSTTLIHQAVFTNHKTFLVLYAYVDDEWRYEVGEFDEKGTQLRKTQFKWNVFGVSGSSVGFGYLTVIDVKGNFIVSDFANNRVLLFNSSLQLKRILLDDNQIKNPFNLHYNKDERTLYVVGDNRLVAFTMNFDN